MSKKLIFIILSFLLFGFLIGCGGEEQADKKARKANSSGLSDFQLEHGIGPITEKMQLAEIDQNLTSKGEEIFKLKCLACHKLDTRFIGPALRYVTKRRSPEYFMNMVLNPDEMVKRHPEAKKVLVEYLAPMTNQNLSNEEARALLEYMRFSAEEGTKNNIAEVPLFK